MKTGKLHIERFGDLNDIAIKYNVKAGLWATASSGPINDIARISELRAMLKLHRKGGDPSIIGRAFTMAKAEALRHGLQKLIGGDTVKKELERILNKAKTKRERIMLQVMALDDDQEETVTILLDAILNKIPDKT